MSSKFFTRVSKQSIHNNGNRVNQLKVAPFKVVGNTQYKMASFHVYKLICVVYTAICSSGFVLPSYLSMVKFFQFSCNGVSVMASENRCLLTDVLANVPEASGNLLLVTPKISSLCTLWWIYVLG